MKNMKNLHRMGGKLDIRWSGPYEVIKDCGKLRFQLKSIRSNKQLKRMVNCTRLKPYIGVHMKSQKDTISKNEDSKVYRFHAI